jgi:hypothetical protein
MGVSYRGTCPFCHTEHVELRAVYAWSAKGNNPRALFQCGFCGEGVIRRHSPGQGRTTSDLMQYSGDASNYNIGLHEQWPEARSTDAPADCPANVANFFKQAAKSLDGGNFDAAGMMFRKALESATKALNQNSKAKNLAGRIKELVAAHLLTPALGDWANEVRLGGNDAAHEEDPFTQEEAQSLHHFTENFLNYTFTMPAAVTRRAAAPTP